LRIVNVEGRSALLGEGTALDVHDASAGAFGPDPMDLLERWAEFADWARSVDVADGYPLTKPLGPPVPRPRQIFAVGLNYVDHAHESGLAPPTEPMIFTKFASALTGPEGRVDLPEGNVDWEVELVLVIGATASKVSEERAWDHVAGLMVGQDLSERISQFSGATPQFSLAKSFAGFAPTGPSIVSLDEVVDRDNLVLGCRLNGEVVQHGTTADMIFPVPEIVARLSRVVTLLPGDLVFTGTPPGVGMGRTPRRYVAPGDTLESYVEGLGVLRQHFATADEFFTGPTPTRTPTPAASV
jgi:2,4-diketo-3-deoxy-L-fuconate hydrolase